MVGLVAWMAVAAWGQDADPTWAQMKATAEALQPLVPGDPPWHRMSEAHAVDLLQPLPGNKVLVGKLNVTLEGVAHLGWARSLGCSLGCEAVGHRPALGGRRRVGDGVDRALGGGRPVAQTSVVMGIDVDTGESAWSTTTTGDLVRKVQDAVVVWRRGRLEALALSTGEPLWNLRMAQPIDVVTSQGAIRVRSSDAIVSIDAGWGAEDWRFDGSWELAPSADGLGVLLHAGDEVRWLDAFGKLLWSHRANGVVRAATSVDRRGIVVVDGREGQQVAIIDNGERVGTVPLDGRLASNLAVVNGVVALTTEDELVAFSPEDGSLAYRKSLPEPFVGWAPSDHPEIPQGQPDVLHLHDEQLIVVREWAGIASYSAAHFDAGVLGWSHLHAEVGADALSVAGRFQAIDDTIREGASDGALARRRLEFAASRRRAAGPIAQGTYLRPFRRASTEGYGALGLTLVDLTTGQRADVPYGPLLPDVVKHGLDLPAVALDTEGRQLIVASPSLDPTAWLRMQLGPATVPSLTVRSLPLYTLTFGAEATTLLQLNAVFPPMAAAADGTVVMVDPTVGLAADGGPTVERCVALGIVEANAPPRHRSLPGAGHGFGFAAAVRGCALAHGRGSQSAGERGRAAGCGAPTRTLEIGSIRARPWSALRRRRWLRGSRGQAAWSGTPRRRRRR